jgi:CBS-domain-containing membrane protein
MEDDWYFRRTADPLYRPYSLDSVDRDRYIDLHPYIDRAALTVPMDYCLYRTYHLFRSQGVRHMVVLGERSQVVGMITRKDLIGQNIEVMLRVCYTAHVILSYNTPCSYYWFV